MEKENELIVLEQIDYAVTIESATELVKQYETVPEFDPANGVKDEVNALIIKNSKLLNKESSSVEKLRKQFKEPSLTYGREVDSLAKEIQAIYEPAKLKFAMARKQIDQYEKEQEQKRLDVERERVEAIGTAITQLKMIPLDAMGKTSEELTSIYESIEIPSLEIYAERLDEAMLTYKDTMNKLEVAIETTIKAEQAESIQAEADAERERVEAIALDKQKKEREAFEKEKAEFAEMKAEREREAQAQQEDINRQNAEREEEELSRQQKIEAEEQVKRDEIERVAQEKNAEKIYTDIQNTLSNDYHILDYDALDTIDAMVFNGDSLHNQKSLDAFKYYINRWTAELNNITSIIIREGQYESRKNSI